MRLNFSPKAALDLEEIGDYIARDNPTRACSFVDEIKAHCYKIAETPTAFALRNDLMPGLRMSVHGRYLLFFHVQNEEVRIERVIHSARRLEDLLLRHYGET